MRKRLAFAIVLALLATGAVVASVAAAASPGSSSSGSSALQRPLGKALTAAGAAAAEATPAGATRLVVVGIDVDAQFVDVDPRGDSPGDYVVLTHHLFDEAGKRIGRDQARCMLMFRDELYCEANLIIAGRGELVFEGFADDLVPVVGGTGEFKKARGQGRVIPVPNGAKFVFTLFL